MMGQEAERLEQQVQAIDQQLQEMNSVKESIIAIKESDEKKEKTILANLGKGIFIKADLKDKALFVNVGKDVIVKKTPDETLKIIEEQNKRLLEGKEQFIENIREVQEEMQKLLMAMQKEHGKTGEHSHECECGDEDCECEEPCEDCDCKHEHKESKKGKKK